jgi:hypothetical protein
MYSHSSYCEFARVHHIHLQIERLFFEGDGSGHGKIDRRVCRHRLRGWCAGKVRPEVLRTGALNPEARLDQHAMVVLDAIVRSGIQSVVWNVRDGQVVIAGARDSLGSTLGEARSSHDVVRKIRRLSREIQEEMKI